MQAELDARAKQILKTLVCLYIESGAPVGSRTLARNSGLDVSPATVRNIVSDLEEAGLVRSPHPSAGRIPTARGYRLFVGIMLDIQPLDPGEQRRIHNWLKQQATDVHQLFHTTSRLISGRTHYVGIVLVPRLAQGYFRQIEFLTLSTQRILAILVTSTGLVQNRVVDVERPYSESELKQAANYLNERFMGQSLEEVRRGLLQDLQRSTKVAPLVALASELGAITLDSEPEEEMFIEGQSNLLDYPEFREGSRLRDLFKAIEERDPIVRVLETGPDDSRVGLMIGDEVGHTALEDCSVVMARYRAEEAGVGTLAVIGPVRMNYAVTIPFLDCTAQQLSSLLSHNSPSSAN